MVRDDVTVRTEELYVASMGRSLLWIDVSGVVDRFASEEWLFVETHITGRVVMGGDRSSAVVIPLIWGRDSGSVV